MSSDQHPYRVLVIQLWTIDVEPIERALREAGIDASITRVDFKAAVNAALAHERFDAAIFDANTPDLARETIEACFRSNARDIPLVVLGDVTTLGARLLEILEPRRS